MNSIRIIVGELFQSPMSNMSVPAYINYVNTAGKISQRSMLELDAVILTIIEQQEKINQQSEENFKQIFEILAKLVKPEVKLENPEEQKDAMQTNPLQCPTCGKILTTKLALAGHSRSHKPKV